MFKKTLISFLTMSNVKIPFLTLFILLTATLLSYGQNIYFQSTAEVGDLSEWVGDGGGGVFTAPGVSTKSLWTPEVHATREVAHTGNYSIRCYLADPAVVNNAKLMRWRIDQKNAYYSAWYYFDENYTAKEWCNIMQWKTETDIEPTFMLEAITINSIRQLRLYHWAVGGGYLPPDPPHPQQRDPGEYFQSNPIPIADNTWVHIEAYYKTDITNGEIVIWQDGKQVFRVTNVNTQHSTDSRNELVMFGVGNYMSQHESKDQLLYVDDVIATDYQVSKEKPAPPQNVQIIQ